MSDAEIRSTILSLFRRNEVMKEIGETENFFELGVSSLTIVQLQIEVENELDLPVPTSDLMRATTINAWIDIYTAKSRAAKPTAAC
jgi:acyl carrier protein